jgi:hypothetical protein
MKDLVAMMGGCQMESGEECSVELVVKEIAAQEQRPPNGPTQP